MATSLPYIDVQIDVDDVPGAKLPYEDTIQANSVLQLKRFLVCRNLSAAGKKEELVKRCQEALFNKTKLHQGVDNGKWLLVKEKEERKQFLLKNISNNRIPPFPITWKEFPSSGIPTRFCFGHIYQYLVTSCVLFDGDASGDAENQENNNDDWSTAKTFKKGRTLFTSGHVTHLQDNVTSRKHYCVKASVMASYTKDVYIVLVMIDQNGNVTDANCKCKASAMGRCSHVAAVLFALEDFTLKFPNGVSCTSKICGWNRGRKAKQPGPIMKSYREKIDPLKKIQFEPRSKFEREKI